MRPGQQAPESLARSKYSTRSGYKASMRPGQQAPESLDGAGAPCYSGFCFNEARAASPGIPDGQLDHSAQIGIASMRPGQQAPESRARVAEFFLQPDLLQ